MKIIMYFLVTYASLLTVLLIFTIFPSLLPEKELGFGDRVKVTETRCIGTVNSQFFESDLYTVELNWCPNTGNTGVKKVIVKRNEVEKLERL